MESSQHIGKIILVPKLHFSVIPGIAQR